MAPSTSKNLLWIAPRWCFPADDGAKIAQLQLLRPLAARGWNIHLFSIPPRWEPPQAPAPTWVRESQTVPRGAEGPRATRLKALRSLDLWARGVPYSLVAFRTREIREACARQLERKWDLVVVDGLHAAAALPDTLRDDLKLAYRAHNIESDILLRAAREKGLAPWLFLMWQGQALARFERELVGKAHVTCAVSDTDAAVLRDGVPGARVETVPIGLSFPETAPAAAPPGDRIRLFFAGRLDWEPNRDGLEAFLRGPWQEISRRAPGRIELRITGRGDAAWLEPYRAKPGVILLGALPSLGAEYAAADACLIPLRYGSGVRVKALEAAQHGRAIVSSTLGVEGLGLREGDYFRADRDEEWIEILLGWNRTEAARRTAGALASLRRAYSEDAAASRFDEILREVLR